MTLRFVTECVEETRALGKTIGEAATDGLIVTLSGDLGAGKTALTKGIAEGLGVERPEYVTSPTFTIHKVYRGRLTLNHLDFYRLEGEGQLEDLGLEDTLGFDGVSVIEWPDNFFSAIGTDRLDLRISVESETRRVITVEWSGRAATLAGEALAAECTGKGGGLIR